MEETASAPPHGKKPSSKPRNAKQLPAELLLLTEKDTECFVCKEEADPNPKSETYGTLFTTLQEVKSKAEGTTPQEVWEAHKFTVDQLRQLCKRIGVTGTGSLNKYAIRRSIAVYLAYLQKLKDQGLTQVSHDKRMTATICRAVNVVFSESFVHSFQTVNDAKARIDHETSNTHKNFWASAAIAHNDFSLTTQDLEPTIQQNSNSNGVVDPLLAIGDSDDEDDGDEFSQIINPKGNAHLAELATDHEINLLDVDQFETNSFRKMITTLFRIRANMKKDMTVSGTHDNDAWNFVDNSRKAHARFTKLGVYYFYERCEEFPDMDAQMQPFMDPTLKGSSEDDVVEVKEQDSKPSSGKKATEQAVERLMDTLQSSTAQLIAKLGDSKTDRKRYMEEDRKERKRAARDRQFHQQFEIAKLLGDKTKLKELGRELAEARAADEAADAAAEAGVVESVGKTPEDDTD